VRPGETVFGDKTVREAADGRERVPSAEDEIYVQLGVFAQQLRTVALCFREPVSVGVSFGQEAWHLFVVVCPQLRQPGDRRQLLAFVEKFFADTHEREPRGGAQPVFR
jgi:hypothetical protein